ncbi:hypothetical protein [Novilysobacter antarcticus]|uniref:hypothetical protein n=1 Tax=Novilysobacter antarcticus TaxID=2862543 RepID=UPI001C9A281D|nr:hypothetical protein [Lysobacter antarcticus]
MANQKGASLEELVRGYFSQQGFFALRGASFQFEGGEVTDLDVWLYWRQGGGLRTRSLVDVKNKRSPKAMERIIWAKGMQSVLGCDRALVATTDTDLRVARFARQQNVSLLTKTFIARLENSFSDADRLTAEEFTSNIRKYPGVKQDGDWLGVVESVKTALVSGGGFAAFNQSVAAFKFFAQKLKTRSRHSEQALRCAYLMSAYSCIALDIAVAPLNFESSEKKYESIMNGVKYGDNGEGRVQASISSVLEVISSRVENGRVIAAQARGALDGAFSAVRAEVIAEFFATDAPSVSLFRVAKDLERRAHASNSAGLLGLSIEEKQLLGLLCDFTEVARTSVFSPQLGLSDPVAVTSRIKSDNVPVASADTQDCGDSPQVDPRGETQKKLL